MQMHRRWILTGWLLAGTVASVGCSVSSTTSTPPPALVVEATNAPHPPPLSPEYRGEGSNTAPLAPVLRGEEGNLAPLAPVLRGEGWGVRGNAPQPAPAAKPAVVEKVEVAQAPKPALRDRARQLIAATLQPGQQAAGLKEESRNGPLLPSGPRSLEQPEMPLPRYTGGLVPAPVLPSAQRSYPHSLPKDVPLRREATDQTPPAAVQLPSKTLVRLPGPELETPVPVPVSGPRGDSAVTTDPTLPQRTTAALAQPIPARTAPVPFERLNLPDPFEYQRSSAIQPPPAEVPPAPLPLPQTPAKSLSVSAK